MDPEPWLSGTLLHVPPVQRAVLHALQLAEHDLTRWCADLSLAELNARAANLPSIAFQLRHIARSIDRLLTYADIAGLSGLRPKVLRAYASQGLLPAPTKR